MTLAYYIVENDYADEVKSVIKFGAMDKEGLEKSQLSDDKVELNRIRTKNKTTWDINLDNVAINHGGGKDKIATDLSLRLEPQLPYIYFPGNVYKKFSEYINKEYEKIYMEPVCNFSKKACIFKMTCDKVQ